MDIGSLNQWGKRTVPSPIFLMSVVKSTSVPPQDLYYAMMGMGKSDFERAEAVINAIDCVNKGGLGELMAQDVDDACNAILHGNLDEEFDSAVRNMASTLSYIDDAVRKAEKKDKDKDEDEGEKPEESPEKEESEGESPEEEKPEAPVEEEEIAVEVPEADEAMEEAEMPPEAPAQAPAIDMASLLAEAPKQVAIDPELVMRALQLLQSIGAMC